MKTGKKEKTNSDPCITCGKSCSMSGLCMVPWLELKNRETKGNGNVGKDSKKDS